MGISSTDVVLALTDDMPAEELIGFGMLAAVEGATVLLASDLELGTDGTKEGSTIKEELAISKELGPPPDIDCVAEDGAAVLLVSNLELKSDIGDPEN